MGKYTTGEIAKLCNVTVRTVQYYDSRHLLVPTTLSDGGRRLYSQEDVHRLRMICFLKETGFSLEQIRQIINEKQSDDVISVLLEQQETALKGELLHVHKQLRTIEEMRKELKYMEHVSVDLIGEVASILKNKKKRKKMLTYMILWTLLMELLVIVSLVFSWFSKTWWTFIFSFILLSLTDVILSLQYHQYTSYICPTCHTVFKPSYKEVFFAFHTTKLRRVTCPNCLEKKLCVEIYQEEKKNAYFESSN